MIKSLFTAVLSLATLGLVSTSVHGDDLFSRIKLDSAFSSKPTSAPTAPVAPEPPEQGRRLLSVKQLADLLSEAKFDTQTEADRFVLVKLEKGDRTFPVALNLSDDYDRLQISMLLSRYDGDKELPNDRLLALLAANRENHPAVFTYGQQQKQLEIVSSLKNDQLG